MPLLLVAATAGLFYLSATAARGGERKRWAITGIAALSLFAIAFNAAVLPSIDRIWPTREIERALAGCPAGPVAVLGFREPSAKFVLKSDPTVAEPDALRAALVEGRATYIVGEARDDASRALNRFQYRRPRSIACVEAYNVMRGCPLAFHHCFDRGYRGLRRSRDSFPATKPSTPRRGHKAAEHPATEAHPAPRVPHAISPRPHLGGGQMFNPENPPEITASRWYNGDKTTLKAMKGKVVVVAIFQILCPGSAKFGLPQAMRLRHAFNDDEVAVIGLHMAFEHFDKQSPDKVEAFLKRTASTFPSPTTSRTAKTCPRP